MLGIRLRSGCRVSLFDPARGAAAGINGIRAQSRRRRRGGSGLRRTGPGGETYCLAEGRWAAQRAGGQGSDRAPSAHQRVAEIRHFVLDAFNRFRQSGDFCRLLSRAFREQAVEVAAVAFLFAKLVRHGLHQHTNRR